MTRGAATFFVQSCFEQKLNVLWVETTYGNIMRYYERYFLPELKKFPKDSWSYNIQRNELKMGDSVIDFRSADAPENIEGFGYNYVFLNEAGHIMKSKYLYQHAVLPMLIDYPDSKLIAGGVPKGRRWKGELHPFYEMYLKTVEDPENYKFFHYTTYDNPILKKEEIDSLVTTFDQLTYKQEIMAEFIDHAEDPFLYAFDEDKHVIETYEPNLYLPLILSFDFNVSPMTAIIGQSIDVRSVTVFDEFVLRNSSTPELCEAIRKKYPQWVGRIIVTGDASGRARSAMVRGGLHHYKIIKRELSVRDFSFKVRKQNLSHINSRVLCNSVLQNANFRITRNCKTTIADAVYAAVDGDGGLLKSAEMGNHALDCLRYMIDATYPDFIDKPKKYGA